MNATIPMTLVAPAAGRCLNVLGIETTLKLDGRQTAGAYALVEFDLAPGMGVPVHIHDREDETFIVLAGAIEITCAGQAQRADAGTVAFLPRGVPHRFANTSSAPARVIVLVSPAGFEGFFIDLDQRLCHGDISPAELAEMGAKYGLTFIA